MCEKKNQWGYILCPIFWVPSVNQVEHNSAILRWLTFLDNCFLYRSFQYQYWCPTMSKLACTCANRQVLRTLIRSNYNTMYIFFIHSPAKIIVFPLTGEAFIKNTKNTHLKTPQNTWKIFLKMYFLNNSDICDLGKSSLNLNMKHFQIELLIWRSAFCRKPTWIGPVVPKLWKI